MASIAGIDVAPQIRFVGTISIYAQKFWNIVSVPFAAIGNFFNAHIWPVLVPTFKIVGTAVGLTAAQAAYVALGLIVLALVTYGIARYVQHRIHNHDNEIDPDLTAFPCNKFTDVSITEPPNPQNPNTTVPVTVQLPPSVSEEAPSFTAIVQAAPPVLPPTTQSPPPPAPSPETPVANLPPAAKAQAAPPPAPTAVPETTAASVEIQLPPKALDASATPKPATVAPVAAEASVPTTTATVPVPPVLNASTTLTSATGAPEAHAPSIPKPAAQTTPPPATATATPKKKSSVTAEKQTYTPGSWVGHS